MSMLLLGFTLYVLIGVGHALYGVYDAVVHDGVLTLGQAIGHFAVVVAWPAFWIAVLVVVAEDSLKTVIWRRR